MQAWQLIHESTTTLTATHLFLHAGPHTSNHERRSIRSIRHLRHTLAQLNALKASLNLQMQNVLLVSTIDVLARALCFTTTKDSYGAPVVRKRTNLARAPEDVSGQTKARVFVLTRMLGTYIR